MQDPQQPAQPSAEKSSAASQDTGEKTLKYWLEKAKSADAAERAAAMHGFAHFADQADEIFFPLLEGLVKDPDSVVQDAAQETINQLADPLAAEAIKLLDSDDPHTLGAGCEMINRVGPAGNGSVPKLVKMMQTDPEPFYNYHKFALFAACNLRSNSEELMTQAIRFLDDDDFNNQVCALRILRNYGPAAAAAAEKIKGLTDKGNTSVRSHSLMTLAAIGPVDEFDVVDLIVSHLNAFQYFERKRALTALGMMGSGAAKAKEAVEQLMNNPEKGVQCDAAVALWKITGDAEPSLKTLIELGKTVDLEEDAVFALGSMGSTALPAADFLASKLDSEDESFRLSVLDVIERIGALDNLKLKSKIESLAKSDPSALVRDEANRVLERHARGIEKGMKLDEVDENILPKR